jgi:3-methyladenine DNA glycosylase AlkD
VIADGKATAELDTAGRELIDAIRTALAAAADPARAPAMQAYMKSAMPYLGVAVPVVRACVREQARSRPPSSTDALRRTALTLWREATHREHRYAATELCALRSIAPLRTTALLPLYEEQVVTGGWWDHTDAVAHLVGELLRREPASVRPRIRAWATDPDRWLRRLAVISQNGFGADTDTDLLAEVIDANAADRDFFLRKGIGWALREFARTDPEWVRGFLSDRGDRLSPLTRREAAKHLGTGAPAPVQPA